MHPNAQILAINQALDRLSRNDLVGAEAGASAALTSPGQEDASALHVMGLVRMRQGRWEEAADFLARANMAKPRQPGLLLQLGQALAMLRRPEDSIAALAEAVALQPGLGDAWYEMANQQQQLARLAQAETSYRRALALQPEHGPAKLGLGRTLSGLGRFADAENILAKGCNEPHPADLMTAMLDHLLAVQTKLNRREAVLETMSRLQALSPVRFNLDGKSADPEFEQQQSQQLLDAEASYRGALAADPDDGAAMLGLGRALNGLNRFADAESVLAQGCAARHPANLMMALLDQLRIAQSKQHRCEAALDTIARQQALAPQRTDLDGHQTDQLLDLSRFDEALAVIKTMLARDPGNIRLHEQYNHILYQLQREDELLCSYDRAPPTTELQMSKALFALTMRRGEEAQKLYSDVLVREPDNIDALVSAAAALDVCGRHDAAMALAQKALARFPDDARVHTQIAGTALLQRDPEKAVASLQNILAAMPHEGFSLARLGTAWRMMGDARDETLMGYDDLVRVFDLEPPSGYSSMAAFNQELEHYLDSLHPPTREFLGQSLRGGTQTRRHLFGAGHDLVERVKLRIDEAVGRYISEMGQDPEHPLRARRRGAFTFTGAWSSRLSDCGFHANHIHPMGWISSCYYVGLPEAVKDEQTKQGWIKFGEPDIDVGLTFRRAIQPVPGRLVLFPSYLWHGTIPFHDSAPRTTIAFDVLPA